MPSPCAIGDAIVEELHRLIAGPDMPSAAGSKAPVEAAQATAAAEGWRIEIAFAQDILRKGLLR